MGSVKDLQEKIIKDEGFILSDGTLNLNHLLSKAHDLIQMERLEGECKGCLKTSPKYTKSIMKQIRTIFHHEDEEKYMELHCLYDPVYYGTSYIPHDNMIQASELWNETIFNFFNEVAPDGYYFGSSEGDGALIGWFKYEEVE